MVIRFWLRFPVTSRFHNLNLGCGVTARSFEDALFLVREAFPDLSFEKPVETIENVDVSRECPNFCV